MADAQRRAELILEFKDNLSAGANTAAASLGKVDASSQKLQTTAGATEQQFGKLAAQLNNGTKTAAAQASIGQLDGLLKSGKISADQYGAAVGQIQLKSGLASKGSMEAADSLMQLGKQFSAGKISSDEYAAGVSKIQTELNNSQSAFERYGATIKNVAVPALAALGAALAFSVNAALESEVITAKTEAVIKSTGGAAGYTSGQIAAMAQKFSELTGVDDELIQSAQNVMLTFTNIGHDKFPQAMLAAQNLSAALGTDLQGAVTMVGKALQDPEKGLTALKRAGVNVNDEMKRTVSAMVAVGDTAGAQAFILNELNIEFGGMAEALGETTQGKINKARNALENLGEAVGNKLLPFLGQAADAATTLMTWQDKLSEAFVDTENKIRSSAKSYDEYKSAVLATAKASGDYKEIQSGTGPVLIKTTESFKLLTQAEWDASQGAYGINGALDESERALRRAGDAAKDITQEYETLEDRLKAGEHILSPMELGMKALAEANYANSDASRAWDSALKDHQKVLDETAKEQEKYLKAAGEWTINNQKFVESFKDFTAIEGAKQTISDLQAKIKENPEDREKYAAQIRSISQAFGITTPAMEVAADTFRRLEDLWSTGALSTESYAKALGNIQQAAADGKVSVDELGLKTGEAAAYMTAAAGTAKTEQEGIVNDARANKQRMMDEMNEGLAGQQTMLEGRISDSMLGISNSLTTAKSLADTVTKEIKAAWGRIPTEVTTTYHIRTTGSVPQSPANTRQTSGQASGGIIAGATGMIARGPTYLVGEGNYNTFAGQGAEGVIPLNDRGINILAEALARAMERMPAPIINNTAMPGIDLVTRVSQGLAAQTRQARRAGAGAMGR